jgi:hypothetical protein
MIHFFEGFKDGVENPCVDAPAGALARLGQDVEEKPAIIVVAADGLATIARARTW